METTELKYHYSFTGYGILNQDWLKENGNDWRAGRIEVHDPSECYAVEEHGIIYREEEPGRFEDFVDDIGTGILYTREGVLELFKESVGEELEVWSPET